MLTREEELFVQSFTYKGYIGDIIDGKHGLTKNRRLLYDFLTTDFNKIFKEIYSNGVSELFDFKINPFIELLKKKSK
jgi:hypothetical protein